MQIRDSPCGIKARQSTLCLAVFIHQQFLKAHLICLALAIPRVPCLTLQTLPRLAFPCMPMPHPGPAYWLFSRALPCLALLVSAWPTNHWVYLPLPRYANNFWFSLDYHSICFSPHHSGLAYLSLDLPTLLCLHGRQGRER